VEQRNRDPYFRFYMNFINFLGQHGLEETYKNFPKCSNLIYLDTAVSGLASHTILKGFQNAGYKPYTILVVDSYGAKLKPSYTWILRRLEAEGYARKILVSKLIAEDTNSALLGVGATIYPTILMANWNKIKPIGAVNWHPASGKHLEAFTLLQESIRKSLQSEDPTTYLEKLNKLLETIKDIGEHVPPIAPRIERIEETRGGALSIYLTQRDTQKFSQKV
jgi:hypothetical protein